jgi:hypothetical protein
MQTAREPHLFTVEEYMQLNIPGRTELLGGLVYDVSPKYPPLTLATRRINKALTTGLSGDYAVSVQDPIAVKGQTGKYAPEIDIAVIAEKVYTTTRTDADSFAFVEVSDRTYKEDREVYVPLYVATGVPTWQVNIPDRQVEFYEKGQPRRIRRPGSLPKAKALRSWRSDSRSRSLRAEIGETVHEIYYNP